MSIEGKTKMKSGIELTKSYLRIYRVILEHWLDDVYKLKIEYYLYADQKARDEKLDPVETKLVEVTVIQDEIDASKNILDLAYTRLKLLQEFNEFKDK